MPVPVTPAQIKELLASPSASLCEKMFMIFKLPKYVYDIFSFFVTDSGKLSVEGASFLCSLNCGGTGTTPGPGGGTLTAPIIQASDGAFLDRVRITWPVTAGATSYTVYRNLTDDSSGAGIIGTTATTSFDDTTAAQGTTYFYWVKAGNLTTTSAFSNSDSGFAATALAAITDLGATQGYGGYTVVSPEVQTGIISLVWTPPVGAARYDIYRSALPNDNTFGTAVKIATDRVPFDNSASLSTGPQPTFVDNGGELLYIDTGAPTRFDTYYYWVVAKAGSGASLSPESNGAAGWAIGDGAGAAPSGIEILASGDTPLDVPAGSVRVYALLFGSGAGGAGAGATFGGGAGGGPAVVHGRYNLDSGKLKVVSVPNAHTGRANSVTNGANASSTTLQHAANGVTYSTVMTVAAALGGVYNGAGGGAGGAGSAGSVAGGVTNSLVRLGRAGGNAMGSKGGRSGYFFGSFRLPPAHFNVFDPAGFLGDGSTSGASPAGSGSNAHPAGGTLTFGGEGKMGRAIVYFYDA